MKNNLVSKNKRVITSRDWVDNLEHQHGWTPLVCNKCSLPFHGWKLKTKCMLCSVPKFPTDIQHITHSAVIHNGVTFSLPAPYRHHHVLVVIYKEHGESTYNEQGFLDNEGKFLTREEAFVIAKAAGQIKDITATCGDRLYSEDIW